MIRGRLLGVAAIAVAASALTVPAAWASIPVDTTVNAPAAGSSTAPVTWTGTIPAGSSNPTSACPATGTVDAHTITWTAQPDPLTTRSSFTASIAWTPSNPTGNGMANDEVLSIFDASGKILASSDGSATSESVTLVDPASGVYTVVACGYVNTTAQPYTGTVTATSTAVTHAPAPVAEGTGPAAGLPEVPYAVVLPLVALVSGAVFFRVRRRRSATS